MAFDSGKPPDLAETKEYMKTLEREIYHHAYKLTWDEQNGSYCKICGCGEKTRLGMAAK